jgi:beta-catenin-like protein 1
MVPVVEAPDPGLELSEEERMKILQMVEDEPEGVQLDESSLKRMVSVLEKRIAKNQEMRIKFPDQPEKFMESEVELHESIQELHALPTMPELYPLSVDLSLPSILLGLLAHENADVSCAILDLLQEVTEVDTLQEDEEDTNVS